ncbi:MAG TPA: glycoside hydrolase, partial [Balneolaceae bacterium]|nr:glycoside hydrolase [Balneolaceae bacterium]
GVDTDCGGEYQSNAIKALKQGLITEADIDRALINMFTIRMKLGEFDPAPKVPYSGIKPNVINDPSHNELAMEIATKTPVLLKNEKSTTTGEKVLPFNPKNIQKIAVLGPHADKIELGDYSGPVEDSLQSTPLDGIRQFIDDHGFDIEVVHAEGGNTESRNDFFTPTGFRTVDTNGAITEYDATNYVDAADGLITASRFGRTMIRGIKDGDWVAYSGVNMTNLDSLIIDFNIATNGGSVEIRVDAPTGNIIAGTTVETDKEGNFFGRSDTFPLKVNTLGITGPRDLYFVFREPETPATDKATLDVAKSADVAILFVGTDQSTGREESDRFSLKLPGNQEELIKAVAEVNPNTIVVMQTMGMVEVEGFKNDPNIPGMIFTGYNGQAQGIAMAKILFGEVNPGGKTPLTWYKSVNDLPDFNDYHLRKGPENNGR